MTSIALIVACLVGSAFFSSSETALLRLRESELESAAEEPHGPASSAIRALLASTSRLLVTILLGNNVVNILAASLASALAVSYLGVETGVIVATVVMTVLVLLFCEVLPKAIAAAHPHGVSRLVALPLYLVHQGLRPVHALYGRVLDPLVTRIAGRSGGQSESAEDLLRLARRLRLPESPGSPLAIMGAAADASERAVHEIMVERPELFAFPVETPPSEALDRMLEERYTRAPVYQDSIDQVLGFVHLKDLVKHVRSSGATLREILIPVLRVPERKPILRLLADMQRSFIHLAIVKDEHGITQGMVTQEDILEEIVGEIRDEFDREELLAIRRLDSGEYDALGRVRVLDFIRETGLQIPSERGDTLSGLVFNTLGRGPRRGDMVRVPGFEIEVGDVSGTRIARVRIRAVPEQAGVAAEDETP